MKRLKINVDKSLLLCVVCLVIFIFLCAFMEIGCRIGESHREKDADALETQLSYFVKVKRDVVAFSFVSDGLGKDDFIAMVQQLNRTVWREKNSFYVFRNEEKTFAYAYETPIYWFSLSG